MLGLEFIVSVIDSAKDSVMVSGMVMIKVSCMITVRDTVMISVSVIVCASVRIRVRGLLSGLALLVMIGIIVMAVINSS